MIYLLLFFTFAKVGFFTIGGGYAMIPLVQRELAVHDWLGATEFVDILAISEMTPGPIAVNSATFVGYRLAGVGGAACATLGVVAPSITLLLLISVFFFKYRNHAGKIMAFHYIRPVVTGLLVVAAATVAQRCLVVADSSWSAPFHSLDYASVSIFAVALAALLKFNLNPIAVIAGAGFCGVLFFC